MELYKALFVATIYLGLWTALSLWYTQKGNRSLVILVASLITGLTVIPLNGYLMLLNNGEPTSLTQFLPVLTCLYGPLIYFLVRSAITAEYPLKRDVLHFIPFAVALLFTAIGQFDYPLWILAVSMQLIVYCVISIQFMARAGFLAKPSGTQLSPIVKRQSLWALALCIGLIVLACIDIYIGSQLEQGLATNINLLLPISLGCCVIINLLAFKAIAHPEVVILKHMAKKASAVVSSATDKNELTQSVAAELKSELTSMMEREKLYLNNELSAGDLAKQMGLTTHQLSELLNSHIQQNFYDFLNSYRLHEAKRLLASQDCKKSITDIAFESGFNNRNSFYRVFKTALGLTPSEYRQQLRS